jgi:hypothetical protein
LVEDIRDCCHMGAEGGEVLYESLRLSVQGKLEAIRDVSLKIRRRDLEAL